MNAGSPSRPLHAGQALAYALRVWFALAVIGQAAFVAYILGFYGRAALRGDFERWNDVLVGGWVAGGWVGNLMLALHLFLAVVITVGGILQLLPVIRRHAPALHRFIGRIYLATAVLISLGGLYMVWTRGTAGGELMRIGVSANGALLVAFALLAWRFGLKRDHVRHRAFALRVFVLASGVWFFRIGLMAWMIANGGPAGVGQDFDGPTVRVLAFACYLAPLLVLELCLGAEKTDRPLFRWSVAGVVCAATFVTGLGIVGAVSGMWLPRMVE